MMPVISYFHIEAGNPIVGLWCDECSLPSLIECPVYSVDTEGVGRVGTAHACLNCGGSEGEDE